MAFFKSFITSLIVSLLFALVGLSLFVGNFPPKPSQVTKVFHQYQKMMKFKETLINQSGNMDDAALVEAMEKGHRDQLKALAAARGDKANDQETQLIEIDGEKIDPHGRSPSSVATAQKLPSAPAQQTPQVELLNHEISTLRIDLFRLHQRVVELENKLKYKSK